MEIILIISLKITKKHLYLISKVLIKEAYQILNNYLVNKYKVKKKVWNLLYI